MVGIRSGRTYSIKEVAALVGLPASTLRYYEDVSLIPAIARDPSSGHRIYQEDDLELLTWVSCLSASGMSIADMREYVRSGLGGERDISEFITLLEQQDERLREEAQILELRREFLRTKVSYWRAVRGGDVQEAERLDAAARALANLAKEPVPAEVCEAFGVKELKFGKDYIIPKPFDKRVLTAVAPAVAQAAVDDGVARVKDFDVKAYTEKLAKGL